VKQNSERLHNTTGTATRVAHSVELLIEEFLYPSSPSEQQVCTIGEIARLSILMVGTQ
jgi:hypothetical protein